MRCSDVNLHKQRSYPVADALLRRGIPFVFATGYAADAMDEAYRRFPRFDKPLSSAAILAALARRESRIAVTGPLLFW